MKCLLLAAGVLLLIAVLMSVGGCYTVLRHPTGSGVAYHESYYKSCADCHADAQFYHPYYRYGRSHYYWRDYYGYPWWYNDYWWWDHHDGDGNGEGPEIERGERHLWSPGGWPSKGWGFQRPETGDGTDSPGRPTDTEGGRPPKDAPKQPRKPDKEDKDDDESSEERSLWGSGKKG